ncbi:DUF3108 domain-containing protein [candidate division KSB1 bacterium]|nr:DUF3108 domain-containing protein [candidate division KSB1 bacterium]
MPLLLMCIYILISSTILSGFDLSRFQNERLEFDILYRGINAAYSEMWLESGDSTTMINWMVKSRPLVDLLFRINNFYQTVIDPNGVLLKSQKVIDQKNIQQQWIIDYNWQINQAISDQRHSWPIPQRCHNILAMLYDLRKTALARGDSVSYILDIESQLWQIRGIVNPLYNSFGNLQAHEIVFTFSPARDIQTRAWKTDIVTNRLARPNSQLIIHLGPPPQQQPMLLQFGGDGGIVEMRLKN